MGRHRISDLLLVLLLFAVYAAGAMMLAAIGSDTYRRTSQVMEEDYNLRTGVLYIAEKVRQNDVGGGVRLASESEAVIADAGDALVLTEQSTGRGFETWIFVNSGNLCEVTIASGEVPELAQAQVIMPMQAMRLSNFAPGLLQVDLITSDNLESSITLNVKSDERPFAQPVGGE
jgi:hypothetical protein